MAFVKTASTAGQAINLDQAVEIYILQVGTSEYHIRVRLVTGTEYATEIKTNLADAQAALERWLDAVGHVTV